MVEEAVGNVTSFFRRFVMGALEHQHAPLSQDEDGDRPYTYTSGSSSQASPWWLSWTSTAPPGYGNYAPTLQAETDDEMRRDERHQMEEAVRRSRGDWKGGDRDRDEYEDRYRDRDGERHGGRQRDREGERHGGGEWDEGESEEEREQREVERALEISRREAEEAERARKAEAEAAAAAPERDLINLEADFLGLGIEGMPSSSGASGGGGAGRGGGHLIPYDPTANDEAIARTLNLLDSDFGPSDADLLTKINTSKPKAQDEVDLMSLVDGPSPGLNSRSGALVALNPNKIPFRPSAASQGACAGCSRKIDQGRFLNCLDRVWHPQCFKCKGCSLPISEREFKVQDSSAYHESCWRKMFHPKCSVCNNHIAPGMDGMIQYRTLPFWGDKSCMAHASDATPQCTACNRFQPKSSPFIDLDDGRKLCLECVDTIVVDSNDCMPLFISVQEFYRGLGMPISQEIPLLCVELQALNEAAKGEKDGRHGHSVTRGLCMSEEHTVRAVFRLPGSSHGLSFGGVGQRSETLTRHCEVTAILVLYGLPRLLTGEILAHELMHAWIRLDGSFPALSPDVEEGLCQVMAHLWLQAQLGSLSAQEGATSSQQEFQGRLAEYCMHQIAMDTSPVYGDGFRRAYTATVQHGLLQTLAVVKRTGQLPK